MSAISANQGRLVRVLIWALTLALLPAVVAPIIAPSIYSQNASATTDGIVTSGLALDVNASNATDMSTSNITYGGSSASTYTSGGGGYYTLSPASSQYLLPKTSVSIGTNRLFSVFMWVYPMGTGQLLSQLNSASINNNYHTAIMEYSSTDQIYMGLWNGSDQTSVNSSATIATPKNNWYYIGMVYDGAKLNTYINGQPAGSTSNFTYDYPTPAYFGIGAMDATNIFTSAAYGNMRFGSLSVYTTSLTATQVNDNFAATVGRFGPTVTSPSNQTSLSNRMVTFSSSTCSGATSGSATCNYQWQVSSDSGVTYSDIAGATSTSFTTPVLNASNNGYRYRMKATDPGIGTTTAQDLYSYSGVATLTVTQPPGSDTDTALTLNGSSYAQISSNASLHAADSFTIEAWVNMASYNSNDWNMVLNKESSYEVGVIGGKWAYGLNGVNGWTGVLTGVSYKLNTWQHIALTRRAGENVARFYVDGALIYTGTADGLSTGSVTQTIYPLTIGGRSDGNSTYAKWNGQIDEVRLFKTVRTQSEIQSDMNSYGPINDASLQLYYDCNEGSGSTLYNRSTRATTSSDLTLYSNPTWSDIKSINTSTLPGYTIIEFDRSYLTSVGGWRVPSHVTAMSAFIVGGGGGGGFNSGGGGSGGGVLYQPRISLSGVQNLVVGAGGLGADASGSTPSNGFNSILGATTVSGGNAGINYLSGGGGGAGVVTASGTSGAGGRGATSSSVLGVPGSSGIQSSISGAATTYAGGGGGGGWAGSTNGGAGGSGGGGAGGITSSRNGKAGTDYLGGGGGASSDSSSPAGNGGSGIIIVRWITALKPIFTQPTNDTTTAGLVDTITVSANPISPLTRNYQWQVSTDTGTNWVNASAGSGITSNTYTTPILETTTSGSRYQYRVIVTDSDTAGLFIVDTSVAVFIVVNPRITFTGSYTVQKYGSTHQDTFTVLNGTGSKTLTYSPNNRSGITWASPSANTAVLTIGATLFVGTYFETITATDTKGAQTSLALSIVISKADTITVTAIARSETYTGSTLSFTPSFTVSGLKNSDTVTAASMSWNYNGVENSGTLYAIQSTRPTNAGSYLITPVAPASLTDSYTAVTVAPAELTVNRATRTITITPPGSPIKYGETKTVTASPSAGAGDGSISFASSTTDSCTVSSSTVTAIKSSGTCVFTATITRGNNYETATSTTGTSTLTKADTLTVAVDPINPLTYTGAQIGITPSVTVTGLKLSNAVGATPATIKYTSSGGGSGTCASGGTCAVGDTGPGGGIVFYDAGSQQSWGRYLEIAKSGWNGAGEATAQWCSAGLATTVSNVRSTSLGSGLSNSTTLATFCGAGAAFNSRAYNGGGKTNWFLPTQNEFQLAYNNRNYLDLSPTGIYWLSHEANNADASWVGNSWVMTSQGAGGNNKSDITAYRPIRAFAAGDVGQNFVTTKPTDADTYTVRASALTLSSGSLIDYQGVTYIDATLRINRAQQAQLFLAEYGAIFGTPYKVIVFGGSGTGAAKVSTASGSATGCNVSGDTLTSTSVGTCLVTAVKAQDKNYETATVSINVYFLEFVVQQPAPPASTGPGIALSGATSVTMDPYQAPTISSISVSSGRVGDTVTITGAGFTASALQSVKFWRNIVAAIQGTPTNTQIIVLVPLGATTGKILVTTANGSAVSEGSFTVLP